MRKVLMITNPEPCKGPERTIKEYLEKSAYNVAFTECVDVFDEQYMLEITNFIKAESVDCIFSVGFHKAYSLLCGVLNIKYICWLIDDGQGSAYDYNIGNAWNKVFTAHPAVLATLKENGCDNVMFLPLSFGMEMPDKCEADEAKKDAVIWSIGVREDLSIDSVINNLMDASKGYIDGTLEAIRANIENRSVTASLPDYVLNDLKKNINFEADSYLDFNSFCDYSMFFPTLDRALSFVYYHALLVTNVVSEVSLATDGKVPYLSEKLAKEERTEAINQDFEPLKKYKLVAYFGRFSDGGTVPEDLWRMMAKGIFVLCSANIDFSFMGEDAPDTFTNTWEFEQKARYYINNEAARNELARKVREKVLSLGSYEDRIKVLLGED